MTADQFFDRGGLPSNINAEKMVLGCILLSDLKFNLVAETLAPDDFSLEKHRKIFRRMMDLQSSGRRIDRVTVYEELRKHGEAESVDGLTYICTLDDGLPEVYNLEDYVAIVHEKSLLRSTINQCQAFINRCCQSSEQPADLLADANRVLGVLAERAERRSPIRPASEIIDSIPADAWLYRDQAKSGIPMCSDWPQLRDYIPYWEPGRMYCIAGLPGGGKSSMMRQIVLDAARHGYPVALITLEMQADEVLRAMAATMAGVSVHRIRTGRAMDWEISQFAAALEDLRSLPIWLDEEGCSTITALNATIRRMARRAQPAMIAVDYVQLMEGDGRNRTQELDRISRALKRAGKEYHCAVLALAQWSNDGARAAQGQSKDAAEPELRHIRESGAIGQDSDHAIFLVPEQSQAGDDPKARNRAYRCVLKKGRGGPTGTILMDFDRWFTRFSERGAA